VHEQSGKPFSLLDETTGYYTLKDPLTPIGRREIASVPAALLDLGYELRVMPSLWPLRESCSPRPLRFR